MTERARANSIYMLIYASATGFISQLHPNITDDLDFTGRHQRRRLQTQPKPRPNPSRTQGLRAIIDAHALPTEQSTASSSGMNNPQT
eukprot:12125772-Prorocentrum_lima.AAC.1